MPFKYRNLRISLNEMTYVYLNIYRITIILIKNIVSIRINTKVKKICQLKNNSN